MTSALVTIVLIDTVILLVLLIKVFRTGEMEPGDSLREEFRTNREEFQRSSSQLREEISRSLTDTTQNLVTSLNSIGGLQSQHLESVAKQLQALSDSNQQRIDALRTTVDVKLGEILQANEKKLEEMRKTVDERLHESLEKKLGDSFALVSERLKAVQRGLGEMQTLATGVGDLKRVLSNVKIRGTWAEMQLGAILQQMLSPEQYVQNARVRPETSEVVECAIRLPGPKGDDSSPVLLPIDSKFPQEVYIRLVEASEKGDVQAVQAAADSLLRVIRNCATDISTKYINPPITTPFAVMYLPTEGLYAEVLRQPGILEELQQRFHVMIAGPSTLVGLLSSLQAGFLTLAIEKRASEVWALLGAVRTEFAKFGETLQKVDKQLDAAKNTLEQTGVRSRAIERKLRFVEKLPEREAQSLLAPSEVDAAEILDDAESGESQEEAPS